MTKRDIIFSKFNGLCAYSGTPLEPDWQADHVNPIRRNRDGSKMFPEDDNDDNLVPCQKLINHYKNNYVETIIIEDKSAGFDSIVTRRDTTYYFKNDTLVTRSVRKTK